jgi:S1-C subfamily serine protease
MKIDLKNGALVLLLALAIPSAQAALPNVTADGKPFPTLAPMLKKVNPAVVNIATYSKRETQYNPLLNEKISIPGARHRKGASKARGRA